MKLTGKCKKDFEKWYNLEYLFGIHHIVEFSIDDFYNLPLHSMQYGVYVDFFDSVGIHISTNAYSPKELSTAYWYDIQPQEVDCTGQNTRQEARTKAIEKANDIFLGSPFS